jgi:exonuclease 3'-5' domain-containing protein 1
MVRAAHELVQNVRRCAAVVDLLLQQPEVAVDMEGVELCREGEICLIQVADRLRRVFLFDITVLGSAAFKQGKLGALLGDVRVRKVICDGRADNDALLHLHGVVMQNVYDLQVLYALTFSASTDSYVKGLEACLQAAQVVPATQWEVMRATKRRGKELFVPELGGSLTAWRQRPLCDELVEYAVADVDCMLAAKQKWATPSLDPVVRWITEERIGRAVASSQAARGPHMAYRDFPLSQVMEADVRQALDWAASVTRENACYSFTNKGYCRWGHQCQYLHDGPEGQLDWMHGQAPARTAAWPKGQAADWACGEAAHHQSKHGTDWARGEAPSWADKLFRKPAAAAAAEACNTSQTPSYEYESPYTPYESPYRSPYQSPPPVLVAPAQIFCCSDSDIESDDETGGATVSSPSSDGVGAVFKECSKLGQHRKVSVAETTASSGSEKEARTWSQVV